MKWKWITVNTYFLVWFHANRKEYIYNEHITTDQSSDDDEYEATDKSNVETDDDQDIDEKDDAEDDEGRGVNWRDNLAQKARTDYLDRQSNTKNLMKIVYGMFNEVSSQQRLKVKLKN